jgi:gliding motility-associated-like protein
MKKLFVVICHLFIYNIFSQTILYQDVCNCGISGAGGTYGPTSGVIHFNLNILNTSTISKAFLLAGSDGSPNDIVLNLNGIDYTFTNQDIATTGFLTRFDLINPKSSIYAKEITSSINSSIQDYYLTIPNQNYLTKNIFTTYYLCVIYEDNSLAKSALSFILNQKDVSSLMSYSINNIPPISNSFDVGLSLVGWYFCNNISDGSYVNINTNNIGLIGGNDSNSLNYLCTGTQGHFYYQNNQLFGLGDDTADALMSGSDALANIQNYVSNNVTSFNISLNYQSPLNEEGSRSNPILGFFLSYATPCDTFTTSLLTEDTTVCMGNTVQLGASGGNTTLSKPAYEWLPQKDLSCYDCPNPVFSGDTSRVYTVRIWNTDSCSKVLPVRVKVLPQPKFGQIHLTSTPCGTNNGKITVSSPAGDSLFVNNNFAGLVPATVSGLAAGQYALQLKDTLGCSSTDSVVQIAVQNPPKALFSLIPPSGAAPLTVQANNQSSHANTYQWVWQNQSSTAINPTFQFDTSGTYTITLIASQNGACADTFSLALVVYDSLQITVPNIFTPNNDGLNEVFSVTTNQELPVKLSIQNRWGNDVFTFEGVLKTGENKLWNGEDVTEGVYFVNLQYINPKDKKQVSFQGFVSVSR